MVNGLGTCERRSQSVVLLLLLLGHDRVEMRRWSTGACRAVRGEEGRAELVDLLLERGDLDPEPLIERGPLVDVRLEVADHLHTVGIDCSATVKRNRFALKLIRPLCETASKVVETGEV